MEKLGENVKKILLAGIGAVAATAEKSKDLLDEMVKKGELTVEQGKVLNEELKHNIKKTMQESVHAEEKSSAIKEMDEILDKMTPEQIKALKEEIQKREKTDTKGADKESAGQGKSE
ncbi:phasin family protein [Mediterraneibacter sp. NSJ-55]|uniref:Phasin family protein n=1 Tax=Mediterraneibacter hominis TaxID=2763054 RepID=A0A923RR45_9FIRM|nr:phasin family protein [Mediterraneibacter hominis]MBC5690196.1 phasin family protein [Mediterraneibacter hominis]